MGRPWPGAGEPLFTDEDTAELLDYLADERLICDGCGLPKADTFDPANEFSYRATPLECFACSARARAGKAMSNPEGVYLVVEKRS